MVRAGFSGKGKASDPNIFKIKIIDSVCTLVFNQLDWDP